MSTQPFGPVPLTPTHFLARSRRVFGDRTAMIDGEQVITYEGLASRAERLAGALRDLGISPGDRVSVLAPNTLMALQAHFGVPMAGGVLNALNTRLSADELGYIVGHAGSKVLLVDHELAELGHQVAALAPGVRIVVGGRADKGDGNQGDGDEGDADEGDGDEYHALLDAAEPLTLPCDDEWGLLSLNYTSGTTGKPKGVMYAHRGAYLQALAMMAHNQLGPDSVYLWTLPMFHCNGWCFPWAVTAAGGVHVGLRKVEPERIWRAIRIQGVTHLSAAPTVLTGMAHGPWAEEGPAPQPVNVTVGGAPPSPSLLARLADLGIHVTHLYGLTETYGPAAICQWRPEWDQLPDTDQSRMRARQGVANVVSLPVRVVTESGADVPADGASLGEVVLRGDNVMLGYYRDPEATERATIDGWFRTGDIGVMHPDGYLELRDRSKDIIISGGENIASIEVEQALDSHPAVLECAVVAAPDDKWGEVPVAFVTLQPGAEVTEEELIEHVKSTIARFKAPKRIVIGDLPKTSTGKIQKFILRDRLR